MSLAAALCLGVVLVSLSPAHGHVCDTNLYSKVCDPDSTPPGHSYFVCVKDGTALKLDCPGNLVFNNAIQTCDWVHNVPPCQAGGQGSNATKASPAKQSKPSLSAILAKSALNAQSVVRMDSAASTLRQTETTTTAPLPIGTCGPETCVAPACRCVGADIPGGLALEEVPQMVLLTFDDAVTSSNYPFYDQLFPADKNSAVTNPNNCRTSATFFISGPIDSTNTAMLQTLASRGNEMESHSQSHTEPATWSPEMWQQEMEGEREALAQALGKPLEQVAGMRSPYLSLGGDVQYSMLKNNNFRYDASIYGGSIEATTVPPNWPYTLDYPPQVSQTECDAAGCPTRSYPGLWEVQLIRQYLEDTSLGTSSCAMTDSCITSSTATKEDILKFLNDNFSRYYSTNRAPFMISLHATWFDLVPASFEALSEFLKGLSADPNVYQVNINQLVDWMNNPLPLSRVNEIPSWGCAE